MIRNKGHLDCANMIFFVQLKKKQWKQATLSVGISWIYNRSIEIDHEYMNNIIPVVKEYYYEQYH